MGPQAFLPKVERAVSNLWQEEQGLGLPLLWELTLI